MGTQQDPQAEDINLVYSFSRVDFESRLLEVTCLHEEFVQLLVGCA